MPLEQHPLSRELPDSHAELKQLHGSDAYFTCLATDYENLGKRIYEVENGHESPDDLALQGLKQQQVQLKGKIAERLRRVDGRGHWFIHDNGMREGASDTLFHMSMLRRRRRNGNPV